MTRKHGLPMNSFLRPSGIVWMVEALVLTVLCFVFFNDQSASSTIRFLGLNAYGLDSSSERLLVFLICSSVSAAIASIIASCFNYLELSDRISSLAERGTPMTAEDFLEMRDRLRASGMLGESEFTGVYILHNVSKGKYYVGQSIRVLTRINQHLTGHGNGDIYADFKYGDAFTVGTIPIQGSGYQSLNDLERDAIAAYNAMDHGYNMTRGNRR